MEIPKYRFALVEGLGDEFLPKQGEPTATGWDVRAVSLEKSSIYAEPFKVLKISLGFRVLCPTGWWLELRPRSSTFVKRNLHSLYGVIDQDYSGVCCFVCQYIPNGAEPSISWINHGDALGQLVPVKRQEMAVERVSNEEYDRLVAERGAVRGAGGFGSTDKGQK